MALSSHLHRCAGVLLLLLLLFPSSATSAPGFTGVLVKVIDGDTVDVLREGRAQRVRLEGIDCPERGQPYGAKAKEFVLQTAAGEPVTVQEKGRDRYGRILGEIILEDGRSLNRELVKEGLAWWYRRYSQDPALRDAEEEARSAQRGLWSESDPVPPWEWRKRKRQNR